ncbi:MAG: hypothetical protein IPP94_04845 [Ignavibacteria bacterium]|nr:hypothetical protein [Ignavibacteria bacterium]
MNARFLIMVVMMCFIFGCAKNDPTPTAPAAPWWTPYSRCEIVINGIDSVDAYRRLFTGGMSITTERMHFSAVEEERTSYERSSWYLEASASKLTSLDSASFALSRSGRDSTVLIQMTFGAVEAGAHTDSTREFVVRGKAVQSLVKTVSTQGFPSDRLSSWNRPVMFSTNDHSELRFTFRR